MKSGRAEGRTLWFFFFSFFFSLFFFSLCLLSSFLLSGLECEVGLEVTDLAAGLYRGFTAMCPGSVMPIEILQPAYLVLVWCLCDSSCCCLWRPKRSFKSLGSLGIGQNVLEWCFKQFKTWVIVCFFFFLLIRLSKVIKVQVWGGHGRAVQCALTCLICMCENTLLYKGLLLVSHICGEKRCEIWSMFQEKTVGSFYLKAMQGWPLAMLWTLCSHLQSEANAPKGGG